jgi:hypothetical protein
MDKVASPIESSVATVVTDAEELSNPMEEALLTDPLAPSIALVPLDSRPCNWLYPIRLADIAGVRLHVPPLEFLGWRDRAGDPQALLDWLDALPKSVEGLLVNLDALLYGGLVQSRKTVKAVKSPGEIAGFIARFLRERPGCRLHVMKTIPRIGSTVLRSTDLPLQRELQRLGMEDGSQYIGDTQTDSEGMTAEPPSESAPAAPDAKAAVVDAALLEAAWQEYQASRAVNQSHHLELLTELIGMATSWCIAIEDGDVGGPQKGEAAALIESLTDDLKKKVTVLYGCDEQGMVMLARHLRDAVEGRLPLGLWWADPESVNRVAKFEGIGVGQNLARFMSHLRISPVEVELSMWSSEPMVVLGTAPEEITSRKTPLLMINNFETEQSDHLSGGAPVQQPQTEGVWRIPFLPALLLSEKIDIFFADIAWANGGDPYLDSVFAQGNGNYLLGYSSWNTAGNTIGKVLAHFVCRTYRKVIDVRGWDMPLSNWANERFKFECLLTDRWFPQIVRHRLWKLVVENGGDPWSFNLYTMDLVEKGCLELRKPVIASYTTRHRAIYRGRGFVVPQTIEPAITFPWNRLFEIDLRVYAVEKFMNEIRSG